MCNYSYKPPIWEVTGGPITLCQYFKTLYLILKWIKLSVVMEVWVFEMQLDLKKLFMEKKENSVVQYSKLKKQEKKTVHFT
jgi:hypothetical protein